MVPVLESRQVDGTSGADRMPPLGLGQEDSREKKKALVSYV